MASSFSFDEKAVQLIFSLFVKSKSIAFLLVDNKSQLINSSFAFKICTAFSFNDIFENNENNVERFGNNCDWSGYFK